MKNNIYVTFFIFLFVYLFQTGNFSFSQTTIQNNKDSLIVKGDSTKTKKPKIKKATIPWKAALMSGCLPGLGQMYNRKYWKLPIVWGAIGTSGYFMIDQHIRYIEHRDAYRELINNQVVVPGFEVYANNSYGLKTERDNYERSRNVLIIVTTALWALNIVDALVDAHLSTFDVSPNLSLQLKPATLYNGFNNQMAFGISATFCFK